jgi:LPXTG-site transpeptidase (sortase) family protein
MWRRAIAAASGVVVGVAFVASVQAVDAPLPRPLGAPPPASAGEDGAAPAAVVDSTPLRLVIPSIGVDAKIEARGLDSERNLATPDDYRDVAWYDRSPRPGEPGNAIVNGHVNWWTGNAVFTSLARLRPGDIVRVVRADGVVVTFRVTARRTVDANARVASLFAPSATSTLTLITCSGIWNPLTQSDTQRLLVSTVLA